LSESSKDSHTYEDPSGKNPSNSSRPIQNLDEPESKPILVNYDLLEPQVDNFGLPIVVRKGIRSLQNILFLILYSMINCLLPLQLLSAN
jgi:hypothetical protein